MKNLIHFLGEDDYSSCWVNQTRFMSLATIPQGFFVAMHSENKVAVFSCSVMAEFSRMSFFQFDPMTHGFNEVGGFIRQYFSGINSRRGRAKTQRLQKKTRAR